METEKFNMKVCRPCTVFYRHRVPLGHLLSCSWTCPEFRNFVERADKQLGILFKAIDRDGNGRIDMRELQSAFRNAGLRVSNRKLEDFFSDMDDNNDGYITFDEWRYEDFPQSFFSRADIAFAAFQSVVPSSCSLSTSFSPVSPPCFVVWILLPSAEGLILTSRVLGTIPTHVTTRTETC